MTTEAAAQGATPANGAQVPVNAQVPVSRANQAQVPVNIQVPANEAQAAEVVTGVARAAREAADSLFAAPDAVIDASLRLMARRLPEAAASLLAANQEDLRAATAAGVSAGLLDRLRLSTQRLEAMSAQLMALAEVPPEPARQHIRDLPGHLVLEEWHRPVGVVGANFEARPNVVVDIASQLIKSRNAGVLRTGSAALRSATSLMEHVIRPSLRDAGLNQRAIGLIPLPGQQMARALVRQQALLPLVILRGSGDSTRSLAAEAAKFGVRTLAHADGGGVIYIDDSADRQLARDIIEASLDRLGVCNRLNLLLIKDTIWPDMTAAAQSVLGRLGITASLPPHDHPLGREWALEADREATVTISPVRGPADAARVANEETSGLAAAVIAEDHDAVAQFFNSYTGTAAFHNATPRLLDGFTLFSIPETGINIDRVPGPRGPVTFRDLHLRQLVIRPATAP
jgi:glutamate-5-semialdehyde dehydrogenase